MEGNLYVADTTGIQRRPAGNYANPTTVVTASNVSRIAVDEAGHLYWHDSVTGMIHKSHRTGAAWGAPITVAQGLDPAVLLAVNAVGDVFYSSGATGASPADVYKVPLSPDHTRYGAPSQVVTQSGITSMTVDRVGNVYFTHAASHCVYLAGAGNAPTEHYKVAGNDVGTTGGTELSGVPTATDEIVEPGAVAVSIDGRLYFASKATASTRAIRRVF